MKSNIPDRELLYQYLTENQEKFYRIAYSYVKEREAALDVVQEAIINALHSFDKLREKEYMKTWFYRILIHAAIDYIRKNKKYVYDETVLLLEEAPEPPDHADRIDLYQAVMKLNEKLRTVILLKYFEDLKISEIASVTDAPESTIKTRLKTALNKLAKIM